MPPDLSPRPAVAIIGGGPAGLMAAEVLSTAGVRVDLYDAMPSVGRKFLLAGKGGMNLTHAESHELFKARYGARRIDLETWLDDFAADAMRTWAQELGIDTFVGSSGRVFPTDMKAAPLLRSWLHRLRQAGVSLHMRHRWLGWSMDEQDDAAATLRFKTSSGETRTRPDAVVLALGGGSWARLGSDGAWVPLLEQRGIRVAPLRPANCGFDVGWSEHFRNRFSGHPVKTIALTLADGTRRVGEFVISESGIEGSLVYALSAPLRDEIESNGSALVHLDLAPDRSEQYVIDEVARPRASRSLASHLQSRLGLQGVKTGLLRECLTPAEHADAARLGAAIKALPVRLLATRPLDEAISSAGGIPFEMLDKHLMLSELPGVFCAGEMLDWEAPTGGYLLTACMATGRAAGRGVLA